MLLNFKEICRLCLEPGSKLHPIFDSADKLQEKIQTISPTINLCVGDNLPAQMCQQCIKKVNICYNFKLQCEKSDATLREFLNSQRVEDPLVQVVLKEEPSSCEDDADTITFSKQILPLEDLNRKGPICNGADDASLVSDSNEASYKDGTISPCEDTEEIMMCEQQTNTDGDISQKMKYEVLEQCGKESGKVVAIPSTSHVPSSTVQNTCSMCCKDFNTEKDLKKHLYYIQKEGHIAVQCVASPLGTGQIFSITKVYMIKRRIGARNVGSPLVVNQI